MTTQQTIDQAKAEAFVGKVLADTNPRNGNPYFNTSLFSNEQLGQFGNSRRRFFHGPGLNNFNMTFQPVSVPGGAISGGGTGIGAAVRGS